jgi:hypothetical protein
VVKNAKKPKILGKKIVLKIYGIKSGVKPIAKMWA